MGFFDWRNALYEIEIKRPGRAVDKALSLLLAGMGIWVYA
jgi:hypothetical protein